MTQTLLILPVAAQAALAMVLALVMGVRRQRSMAVRGKSIQDMATARPGDWEPDAVRAERSYANQFELPVLFFAVIAFFVITRNGDPLVLILAWVFVAARVVQAVVHVGSNVVIWRGSAFLAGYVVLAALWGILVWRIVGQGW